MAGQSRSRSDHEADDTPPPEMDPAECESQETVLNPADSATEETRVVGSAAESATAIDVEQDPGRFGDYELLHEIARGGMGVVYKARQVKADRLVALKMILAGSLATEEDVQRFQVEARAAANLEHPHIVPVYDVGEQDGQHFFSMAFVEGQSLAARVRERPLPPREAATLMLSVCEAMAYAHERGVVHRDLKPANVLIDGDGRPRVTDFGLAKQTEDSGLTASGQIMGTPGYMPPEQALGRIDDIGPLADVYSLGATLYCLLTGRPPFQSAGVMDTLKQVLEREPVSPRQVNPAVDRDLETICLKCLEKERGRRYGSAGELVAELKRFLAGEPILARAIGRPEHAWRWCKRNPVVAGWSAAAVLALVTGTVVSATLAFIANEARDIAESETTRANDKAAEADRERGRAETQRTIARNERDEARRLQIEAERLKGVAEDREREAARERDEAKRQRDRARRRLYVNLIASSQRYRDSDNDVYAWDRLESCAWDLRGWEHDYLHTLFLRAEADPAATQPLTLTGSGPMSNIAFGPDGRRIARGTPEKTVQVWDSVTGEIRLTLRGLVGRVSGVAYSPDGSRIAGAGVGTATKVWDAGNGRELLTLRGPANAVAFSPDGTRIATAGVNGVVRVWDVRDGVEQLSLEGHTATATRLAFSPDGRRIASGGFDDTVRVWDAVTGEERLKFTGHAHYVTDLAFSPDGLHIASASGDTTIRVWEAATGRERFVLSGHLGEGVESVAFSPDGRRIASGGSDGLVKIWDSATGLETLTVKGRGNRVMGIAFSPDGLRIAAGCQDETIKIWDATRGQSTLSLKGHTRPVSSVAYHPNGRQVASGSGDRTVILWDVATGSRVVTLEGHGSTVWSVAYAPDGRRLVSGGFDKTVRIWDTETGRELHTLNGHGNRVSSVAFSPDGTKIASASADKTVRVWDATDGRELLRIEAHQRPVNAIAYSPDGARIVSVADDAKVKLWDAADGRELRSMTTNGHSRLYCVAFDPSGKRIVSGSLEPLLVVWDAATGKPTRRVETTGMVMGVTFDPAGRRLAAAVAGRGRTVRIWDVGTGEESAILQGRHSRAQGVAFSPDGLRLATVNMENEVGTIKIRDATPEGGLIWRRRAAQYEAMGDWYAAAFHWGRLAAVNPDDASLGERRAAAEAELRKRGLDVPRVPVTITLDPPPTNTAPRTDDE